ncbi:MAG: hypothetical protein J6V41_03920 [Kiritimatiellae bacterium]|nr:hypothetical protein [Kiritimatiellia bacterium]
MCGFKLKLICILSFCIALIVRADVFVKTNARINKALDRMASTLVYSSEIEVNGAPGSVSVYTLHEYNSLARLAKYLKLDVQNSLENGFRVKLTKDQGGGMLFAFASDDEKNGSNPIVIHFACEDNSTPKWLFPELGLPENSKIQFSVKDSTRDMRMCIYNGGASARAAIISLESELSQKGWNRVTPGEKSTCLFFAKDDSVMLVTAMPSTSSLDGSTVLIMEKK